MKTVNHKELKRVLQEAYKLRKPIMVWGKTGIGKSEAVKDFAMRKAKEEGLEFVADVERFNDEGVFFFADIRASLLEPTDLRGLPSVADGVTKWVRPSILPSNPKAKGLMFFDEVNLAPHSVQTALYQLLLDRRIVEHKLPDGVFLLCAGNKQDDGAYTYELPAPLMNRLIHAELKVPTIEEWAEWATFKGVDNRLIGFLHLQPKWLHSFDAKAKDKVFSTPRTLYLLSQLTSEKAELSDVELFASATVGEAMAAEYVGYLQLEKKVKITELLKNPKLIEKLAVDEKYFVASTIANLFLQGSVDGEKLLEIAGVLEPDLAVSLFKMCGKSKKIEKLVDCKNFKEVIAKYRKYLVVE